MPDMMVVFACVSQCVEPTTLHQLGRVVEAMLAISQMSLWHKKFADRRNIVVIVKTNLHAHKTAHVVLFSSDGALGHVQLIDYYRLRFQLEFNLRDAKQYWGLEDFMSVKERPVYNSANLAMCMVNVSQALIPPDARAMASLQR